MFKIFIAAAILAGASTQLFIEDQNQYTEYADKRNCTKSGPMCEDCKTRVFCVLLPDGEWIKEPLDECPATETCLFSTNQCTNNLNVECLVDYRFICYQTGLFPDAYNCSRYHLCVASDNGTIAPDPITKDCRAGFYYDPITTLCSRRSCAFEYPTCRSVGQSDLIGDHPRLYYTCLSSQVNGTRVLFPQIFYCQDDSLYVDGECVRPEDLTGTGDDGLCEGSGDFYSEEGCQEYMMCVTGDEPVVKRCPTGQRFVAATGGCEEFTCIV